MNNLVPYIDLDPDWVECELLEATSGKIYMRRIGKKMEITGIARELAASPNSMRQLCKVPPSLRPASLLLEGDFSNVSVMPAREGIRPYLNADRDIISADLTAHIGVEINWVIINGIIPVIP